MKYLYFLLFFVSINSFAQNRNLHKMRLMAEANAFPLKVINQNTNEIVTTDSGGFFVMNVQEADELALVENEFYQLKYQLKSSDLQSSIVRIYAEPLDMVLQEVEVERITSKSLGIDAASINKYIYKRNPNPNMDFKALFLWVASKLRKKKEASLLRAPHEMNPYVASLPRSVITEYLKIPEDLVEKFYYFMNDDYLIDQYIKNGEEAKWRMHLLDKSFQFLEQQQPQER
ncbi:hypothetical protein [Paenimyroides aestuarii]|uniref:Uncharacterized protein n=1 Tax=Paenimyroides aestuarii TaxID=2968490 RepID=A0ABY5NU18_9FLAO|nr:hypothetical protein [Paenimyroides aestuarii]UUV22023.1 hypothetical protein NPX36_02980 [Paenimyroides aestuarii]